jgi:hypothetical protein
VTADIKDEGEYIRQLEQVIGKFLEPIKDIPFPVAIKALTGFKVLAFDLTFGPDRRVLEQLSQAACRAGHEAHRNGIFSARPNEAGNHIEPFVVRALQEVGLKATKPISKSGKKKTAGYPDIQIEDETGRIIYLECKTFNIKSQRQSFRTFYFSPSEDPKITSDAFHLLVSFQLTTAERKGRRAFVPVSWHLYTLDKLLVQVKHEFNASNEDLYRKEALLAEGRIGEVAP